MTNQASKDINRTAGMVLVTGAVLAIAFMLHHPSTGGDSFAAALAELRDEASLSGWVHGALIVVMSGIWFGGYGLSLDLGIKQPLPALGFLAFTLGTLAYAMAAMFSGFITPHIGDVFAESTPEQMEHARALLSLTGAANQAFANAGLIGTAVGILAWSLALVSSAGLGRWVGIFGVLVSALPAVLLLTGHLVLHITGMTLVVVAHGAWYALGGVLLLRGGVQKTSR
ncbi:MAG: hypothetical protein R3212_05850 [Xanthomonadales bacterium]|nr:hypothetical protein [Xanthomonadales bacterium]